MPRVKPEKIHPLPYYQGRTARAAGRCRAYQPHPEMSVDSAWWLGGWHDCDMELSHEPKNQPIAATAQAARAVQPTAQRIEGGAVWRCHRKSATSDGARKPSACRKKTFA
ncbi:hypothetical protein EGJ09_00975 [Pseudomonas sp. p106]|nr:hypothetical protein EGJ09_00975 [Pseudomonas sp. p106]